MRKFLNEFLDWIPILILVTLFICFCYYKTYYCKKIPYNTTCKECIEWKEFDNGYRGKMRRTWEECIRYKTYNCTLSYDSCGCKKLK